MAVELPYTISFAVLYRKRLDSFNNLPKDKRPPRDLWDKSYRLEEFLDNIWNSADKKKEKQSYIDIDEEDFE